jgi:hypothetical protein
MSTSPASVPPADSVRWDRLSWRWLVAGCLLRLLYAALYPMDLAGDEAYYWEWSRRLDWGYFSKPPGIAWLMALATAIGGSHTVTIRLTAALIGIGSAILFRQLGRSLFDARAGFLAVLIALATPANVLLNLMLTIDAPLVLCWSAALWCYWRWLNDGGGRWLAGLALAIGCGLLSKQMMLVFPVLAITHLATSAAHREKLRAPGFWIALLASLVCLLPPVWWNARHDWVTFHHTGGQIAADSDDRAFGLSFLEFLATQAGVLSPLLWFFTMAAAFAGLLRYRALGEAGRFLVIFSAPALVVMLLMALRQTMLPNWAAVYYVAGLLLAAGWLNGNLPALRLPERWRKPGATIAALSLGFLMVAAGYLVPPLAESLGLSGNVKLDPMRRLRGHSQVAAAASDFVNKAPQPEKTVIITLGHRYHASHLAFYLPGQPRVYRWESQDHIGSQYEIWPDPIEEGKSGWDAVVFVPDDDRRVPARFERAFDGFEPMGELAVAISPGYVRHYQVFLGRSLNVWPPGMKPEEAAQPLP